MFVFAVLKVARWPHLLDRAKHFDDQHAVMRDDRAPALADDVGMFHLLGVADVRDVIDDVVRVFLEGVIRRAVVSRPASVVIHAQPAAHVNVLNRKTHLAQLRVKPRGLLHGALHDQNVRHLRADVEMQQLEAMRQSLGLEHFRRREQFRRAQAELRIRAAAFGPTPAAFAEQPRADADQRLNAKLPRHRDDLPQLLQLLHHQDHLLPQLRTQQGHADEVRVLVTVAHDQAAHLALQRQAREQLRLAAHFQPEVVWLARLQDFLHHLAKLIHLDREHPAITALVIELGDRVAEGQVDRLDAIAQNILKADQHRELQVARLRLLDHVAQIHCSSAVAQRFGLHAPGVVDVEVFRAPELDAIEVARVLNGPGAAGVEKIAHVVGSKRCDYKTLPTKFNTEYEKLFTPGAALIRDVSHLLASRVRIWLSARAQSPQRQSQTACCVRGVTFGTRSPTPRHVQPALHETPDKL